ncbi:hypothetical protein DSO57_1006990 [Entomophthora muscae]|uniref:Uncharacterized protein n=1 Tax=Entomophthora muscae TaxID=34485 RepID=A0ACC2UH75_9FUNG|nr:hypothetical protein DSO57_1006990 [Entomophthora muscae]
MHINIFTLALILVHIDYATLLRPAGELVHLNPAVHLRYRRLRRPNPSYQRRRTIPHQRRKRLLSHLAF